MTRLQKRRAVVVVWLAVAFAAAAGCGSPPPPAVHLVTDNQSAAPCDVQAKIDADAPGLTVRGGWYSEDPVPAGERRAFKLQPGTSVIHAVRVVVGESRQELAPPAPLRAGETLVVRVGPDGKAAASISPPE